MIIVGEKLNSSIPSTLDALQRRDGRYFADLARSQAEAGADYLDINTAMTVERERDDMLWLMDIALSETQCGIMLDSVRPEIVAEAAGHMQGRPFIINSVSADSRIDELAPIAAQYGAGVVGLPMCGASFPHTAEERVQNARLISGKLTAAGVEPGNIYIDILTLACATDDTAVRTALQTLSQLRREPIAVKTIAGASNVSFGLPRRGALNRAYLAMLIGGGLDAAITDITSDAIKETVMASAALTGDDEYCMDYIDFCRKA